MITVILEFSDIDRVAKELRKKGYIYCHMDYSIFVTATFFKG